ncbi:MAG: hypothetical protein IBX63_08475 [Coriobacteriia bacterium]|nr:hypothetical protein [Coriobacteriia bacterium]
MSGEGSDRIVSGGRRTLRRTPEYEAAIREARERVRADFAPLIVQASFFRRPALRVQRWLRTRREIEALAPRAASYASGSASGRRRA